MRVQDRRIWLTVLLALAAGLAGCGGSADSRVVARVGNLPITERTLDHWMSVLAPRHSALEHDSGLRSKALEFLIHARQLIGGAEDQGAPVSATELRMQVARHEASFPNGAAEFNEFLATTNQSRADVRLEAEAELAASRLRQLSQAQVRPVSSAEAEAYYRKNSGQFVRRERRYFDLIENIPGLSAAKRRRAQLIRNPQQITGAAFIESLERPASLDAARTIVKVIFEAEPQRLSVPIKVERFYFLVKVTHVQPRRKRTLAEVEGAIRHQLEARRRSLALHSFTREWQQKWAAKTTCRAGYEVRGCRGHVGGGSPSEGLRSQ